MLKNNVKRIIVCIIVISMLVLATSRTFASGNILDAIKANNDNTNINSSETPEQIPEGTIKNENVNNNENNQNLNNNNQNLNSNNLPTEKTNNNPTETPNLGVGDYSTYIFIAMFAVSAIYAYKKIRDYNA